MRNKIIILTLFIAVLITGCSKKQETVALTVGDISDIVSETGSIVSNDDYNVMSLVGGRVTSCNFAEDDYVEQGSILYTIDAVDLKNQIQSQNVALQKAELLYKQNVTAQGDLSVKATGNGTIKKLYIEKGMYINTGTKIADIVDNDNLKLKLPFNAGQIDNIYVGAVAEVTLKSNNSKLSGRVDRIYDAKESLGGNRAAVYVEIIVDNPGGLSIGDSATAIINHIASMSEGNFEYSSEKAVVALGSGQVISKNILEGNKVSNGQIIAVLKNDAITNAIDNSSMQIKDIKTSLSQLNDKLSDYTIKAPISGTVKLRNVKLSEQASPTTPLAVISDRESLCAKVLIDEIYIEKVKVGQKANLTIDAISNKTYSGTVKSIESTGVPKDGVTYYTVKIHIDDFSDLKVGMNVDVKIISTEKTNVLLAPTKLINGNKVNVLNNGKPKEVTVTTGVKNTDYTEIIDGLSENDKIVSGVTK